MDTNLEQAEQDTIQAIAHFIKADAERRRHTAPPKERRKKPFVGGGVDTPDDDEELQRERRKRLARATILRALSDVEGHIDAGEVDVRTACDARAAVRRVRVEALGWFLNPDDGEWPFRLCAKLVGLDMRRVQRTALAKFRVASKRLEVCADVIASY